MSDGKKPHVRNTLDYATRMTSGAREQWRSPVTSTSPGRVGTGFERRAAAPGITRRAIAPLIDALSRKQERRSPQMVHIFLSSRSLPFFLPSFLVPLLSLHHNYTANPK